MPVSLSAQSLGANCSLDGKFCFDVLPKGELQVYTPSEKGMTIEQIISPENSSKFVPLNTITDQLQGDKEHWLRITFTRSEHTVKEWLIQHPYQLRKVTIYDFSPDGKYKVSKSGLLVPNSERSRPKLYNFGFDLLLEGESETVYLKLEDVLEANFQFELTVYQAKNFEYIAYWKNFAQGLFQGFLWMLLIYNLFTYFQRKSKTKLYYIGFMFIISIFFINDYQYFSVISDFLSVKGSYFYWSLLVGLGFYTQFIRGFLEINENFPKVDKFLNIYIKASYLYALLCLVLIEIDQALYEFLASIAYLTFILVGLLFIYLGTKVKTEISKYFIIGMTAFFFGSSITVLGSFGVIEMDTIYFQAGLEIQFFVFTLGLIVRQEFQRKNTQQQIIDQLKENELLQTKVNRELEEKVRERTHEISTQNEEILAQSENLQLANDEITTQADNLQAANDEISQNNEVLNTKNKQITDSITYASRIQKAILGDISEIENSFEDAFVFFKPHSIVSGDFYWFENIENKGKNYKIVVAADCTGHGVPGAFMTVMGSDFIDDIVNKEGIIMPNEILASLDKKVTKRLRGQNSSSQVNDGMDISILVFEEGTNNLYFSAAKNPLYYVSEGKMEIIKGSKFAIGGIEPAKDRAKSFDLHALKTQKGNHYYIFSDGFQDQFGGPNDRKYLIRNFRNFLHTIYTLPAKKQKEKLQTELLNWRNNNEQTDDIIVVGIST